MHCVWRNSQQLPKILRSLYISDLKIWSGVTFAEILFYLLCLRDSFLTICGHGISTKWTICWLVHMAVNKRLMKQLPMDFGILFIFVNPEYIFFFLTEQNKSCDLCYRISYGRISKDASCYLFVSRFIHSKYSKGLLIPFTVYEQTGEYLIMYMRVMPSCGNVKLVLAVVNQYSIQN